MVLVFDRRENEKFVPNGYPLNYEYFEDPAEYRRRIGKEKTVHHLFEYNIPKKMSDEVQDNFIYPIEQFGAMEKIIGEDEEYTEYCFLYHIKSETLKKIKDRKGIITINAFEESRVEWKSLVFLHNKLKLFNVPADVVAYISGNCWSAYKSYSRWCYFQKETPIKFVNSLQQLYLKGGDLYKNNGTFVSLEDIERKEKRKHQFLSYNRRIRPPRYAFMAMLHDNDLIKNNLISFSIEDKHDLNCLGYNGRPDRDTMVQIMGRTKLMQKYMKYFNDLFNMSPLTVDVPNLLDVMGPGFEFREPYLNSYFSIVTETSFNESVYCSSEKVFRPMLHYHPFIVHGSPGMLKNLRELGFKTFHPHINESYDKCFSPMKRMRVFTEEVKRLCSMSQDEMHEWYYGMKDILIHNHTKMLEYGKEYDGHLDKVLLDTFKEIKNV